MLASIGSTTGTPRGRSDIAAVVAMAIHRQGYDPGIDQKVDRNKYQGTADQLVADWTGEQPA
jgi:hypothetical protein